MIIPIPSNKSRFTISLGLTAFYPLSLIIIVLDPLRANTHYLRRKVNFRNAGLRRGRPEHMQVDIPLPLSPEGLQLQLYNLHTGGDEGFTLEKISFKAMPAAEIWASEDRHRFMEFAIDFAQKAGYVKPGYYHDNDKEFLIQYLPAITDERGLELVTPARISRHAPRVQLSKKILRRLTVPVRAAILAHEGCHYFRNTRSEKEADLCGIRYYLDFGFPRIEAIYALTKVFRLHPDSVGEPHLERTRDVMNFIDTYKPSKTMKAA